MARVPVLLALLFLAGPVLHWRAQAMTRATIQDAEQATLLITILAAGFVGVAVAGRGRRHPAWLLTAEGVIAALIGIILPLWALMPFERPTFAWPPDILQPLASALSSPPFVGSAAGLGQAANWFVLVLALTWLVVVVELAVRQHRRIRWPQESQRWWQKMIAKRRTGLQLARVLVLLGLLLAAGPVMARWREAFQVADFASMWWTWVLVVGVVLAFLTVAVGARWGRHPLWLLAGEGVIAALISVLAPGWVMLRSPQPAAAGTPLDEWAQNLVDTFTAGPTPFTTVLTLAWLLIVAESAVRQTRRSRPGAENQPAHSQVPD